MCRSKEVSPLRNPTTLENAEARENGMVGIHVSDVKPVIRAVNRETKCNRRAKSWSRGSCDSTRVMGAERGTDSRLLHARESLGRVA